MQLPETIPSGARIVVRITAGIDPNDGRMKYKDVIGHVIHWDGEILQVSRDAAANGSRPAQNVNIPLQKIVAFKPIPERIRKLKN